MISISPPVEVLSFQYEVKGACISKKNHPGVKFHPGFLSAHNMPLTLKVLC